MAPKRRRTKQDEIDELQELKAMAVQSSMSALPHFDWWLAARFDALMLTPQVAVQQIRQPDVITSVRFAQRCQQGR